MDSFSLCLTEYYLSLAATNSPPDLLPYIQAVRIDLARRYINVPELADDAHRVLVELES